MKNTYVKPEMQVEVYATNNCYAKKCENIDHKVYKFVCDAGTKTYSNQYPYYVRNSSGQYLTSTKNWTFSDQNSKAVSYGPCNETHTAEDIAGVFITGLHIDKRNTNQDENIAVTVWRGSNKDNVHCTTKLNMSEWEETVIRS